MIVCFVCGNIYPLISKSENIPIVGGAEVQQYLIGRELHHLGVDVVYVTEDYGQGRDVYMEPFRILSYQYGRNKFRQALTLWQALYKANADIYYVRGVPKFGILIYLFCRLHHRKIVQALASDREAAPNHWPGLAKSQIFRLHSFWRSHADLVIAQNHFQVVCLRERWDLQPEIISSMVGEARFPRSTRNNRELSILWVGSISPVKRIELIALFAEKFPDIKFIIVGGPARKMEDYYRHILSILSPFTNIQWTGYIPFQEVHRYFAEADILLHTTKERHEGFPNVFLEAWVHGIPIVSLGVDPDNLITRHRLGVYSTSIEESLQQLNQLKINHALLSEMGNNALEYVRKYHCAEVIIPRYIQVFEDLLAQKTNSR